MPKSDIYNNIIYSFATFATVMMDLLEVVFKKASGKLFFSDRKGNRWLVICYLP